MSVLACRRKGCENIMCSRYSDKYGYLCDECFNEIAELGIDTDIEKFLATPKKSESYKSFEEVWIEYKHIGGVL